MSHLPTSDITAEGYQPPRITQFNVFLDNRVGKLGEMLDVFFGHQLRIVAFSVAEASDYAVVRLVTSNAELTRRLLQQNRIAFSESQVLVVELDEGQTLNRLCRHLLSAELNIRYAYPLLSTPIGHEVIALQTDDQHLAGQILRKKQFNLIGEADLHIPPKQTRDDLSDGNQPGRGTGKGTGMGGHDDDYGDDDANDSGTGSDEYPFDPPEDYDPRQDFNPYADED